MYSMKSVLKFSIGALIFAGIGWGVLAGIRQVQDRRTPEYATSQIEQSPTSAAASQAPGDAIGGDTPDETLVSFVAALKKGDMGLASQYFVSDAREEWRSDLEVMKKKGLVQNMILDLENRKLDKNEKGVAQYSINTEDGQIIQIIVVRSTGGKWKIREM